MQDEGAQIAALLLEAQPGAQVLDLCAGAGGKTLALAAAMQGRGRLVACDVRAGRSRRAAVRRRRAGAHNVEERTLAERARSPGSRASRGASTACWSTRPAPESGAGGATRMRAGGSRPRDAAELVALQRRLLRSAARLLRPGGRLLYAVCTWLPRETPRAVPLAARGGAGSARRSARRSLGPGACRASAPRRRRAPSCSRRLATAPTASSWRSSSESDFARLGKPHSGSRCAFGSLRAPLASVRAVARELRPVAGGASGWRDPARPCGGSARSPRPGVPLARS